MEKSINNSEDILLNLEIQLDDLKTAQIVIRDNDDIEDVVDKFCFEHNYSHSIKQIIMNQLVASLDNNIEECNNNI